MAFEPTLDEAYLAIKGAVNACGLDDVRVDKVQFNGSINDMILASLRRAQFVIADITLHRNGVYFEAGFAMGLGREVAWCCRKDQLESAHFDVKPYNMVAWEAPAELREKLEARLRATLALPVKF
jgi:nucleoside 2-deoxyribosyltransferase